MIRLSLRFGVSPVFILAGEPQFNGRVENFNGWFQEPLFQRRFQRSGDLRRELARLQEAVNTPHVHPRLGPSRRPSTGADCDCKNCLGVSRCRRGNCRWQRGGRRSSASPKEIPGPPRTTETNAGKSRDFALDV